MLQFVSELVAAYRRAGCAYPVFANLRNGLWYGKDWDGACYFKSTDGHSRRYCCRELRRCSGCVRIMYDQTGGQFASRTPYVFMFLSLARDIRALAHRHGTWVVVIHLDVLTELRGTSVLVIFDQMFPRENQTAHLIMVASKENRYIDINAAERIHPTSSNPNRRARQAAILSA